MQKAVEVEYWVVDREGALTAPGALTDSSEFVEPEFVEPLLELKTPPCESVAALRETFVDQLASLLAAADDLDRQLVPLGTPLDSDTIDRLPGARGDIQRRVIGEDFDYAKHCAGTHVHFEQRNVVDQLNLLVSLDPALALLNSAPYYRGEWVADSARALLYRKWGYAAYPRHGQRWDYVHTVAEWKRRLDDCFDEFRQTAVEAGVDADQVDEHFTSDSAVWTPVRLREEMPTVEWRAPDATLPSQILRLVGEMDDLMECIHHTNVVVDDETGGVRENHVALPPFETVATLGERAIQSGVGDQSVVDYLGRMGFDVDAYQPVSRQFEKQPSVTREEARAMRLRHATLLRRDVERLRE
jgi:carboxylate-amine ligase